MDPQSKKTKQRGWSLPPKRGQIKAQIFKRIAKTVSSAASTSIEIVGMKVHGGGGGGSSSSSAVASVSTTPPPSPTTQKRSNA
ncbi:unnamed protein product [Linum trigynum]|uniref:Uncharacterized protein n=1 Tax=Linum trigynum TaxID=586398 RepID=A0AAV2FYA3_9ROSI